MITLKLFKFKYAIEELAFGVEERLYIFILYLVHEVTTRFYWDAFMVFKTYLMNCCFNESTVFPSNITSLTWLFFNFAARLVFMSLFYKKWIKNINLLVGSFLSVDVEFANFCITLMSSNKYFKLLQSYNIVVLSLTGVNVEGMFILKTKYFFK